MNTQLFIPKDDLPYIKQAIDTGNYEDMEIISTQPTDNPDYIFVIMKNCDPMDCYLLGKLIGATKLTAIVNSL